MIHTDNLIYNLKEMGVYNQFEANVTLVWGDIDDALAYFNRSKLTPPEMLNAAFPWANTHEGHDFWSKVQKQLLNSHN